MNGFSVRRSTTSICVGVLERERHLIDLAVSYGHLLDRTVLLANGIEHETWRRHHDHGTWVRMAPGVWRHLATPDTWALRALATMRWLGQDTALHGASSLGWWGVEAPGRQEPIHVVRPRSKRQATREGVVVHTVDRWTPTDHRRKNGVLAQEPARAIVSVAADGWGAARLASAIDACVHRRITSVDAVARAAHRHAGSGHAGIRMLRSLLLDTGGESFLERRFLGLVRRARLPRPDCQVVHRSAGRQIARVDFLFPGTDVVVEVTGRLGHVSDAERRADARRRNDLQRAGRAVLEFTTVDVLDERDYVVATLTDWLRPTLPFSRS